MKIKKILFVCTGNVFRSMSAEYLLKKYLKDHKIFGWKVNSAGIIAKKQSIDPETIKTLKKLGIKNINHKQKKLTKRMLEEYDVIIPMAENHQRFINLEFNFKTLLFNELATDTRKSIWDIKDDVKDYKTNRRAVEKKIRTTIKNISRNIPSLFKNLSERYFFVL